MVEPGRRPATDELWTCPRCGHRFVTRNMAHSCTNVELDTAFARSRPNVRAAFDHFVELIERCGPVEVIAQKTRITIMVEVRFAGATVLRDRLRIGFALGRRIEHPRLVRVEDYGPRWIVHRLDIREPAELDDPAIAAGLCESYRDLGLRGSLRRSNIAAPSARSGSGSGAARAGSGETGAP